MLGPACQQQPGEASNLSRRSRAMACVRVLMPARMQRRYWWVSPKTGVDSSAERISVSSSGSRSTRGKSRRTRSSTKYFICSPAPPEETPQQAGPRLRVYILQKVTRLHPTRAYAVAVLFATMPPIRRRQAGLSARRTAECCFQHAVPRRHRWRPAPVPMRRQSPVLRGTISASSSGTVRRQRPVTDSPHARRHFTPT